jgi:hypothetical protein
MTPEEIRQRFDSLWSQRQNLNDTLQAIEKYVVPYRGDFFKPNSSEHEVEWRRRMIYDSTAPVAADLLASQIHSNLTSPSIRWFELRFRVESINDRQEAKEWLDAVQNQIWQTLLESDFNMEIAEAYLDLVSFGTAVLFEEELNEKTWEGVTFTAMPVRHTCFEYGADDNLLRFYRRLQYTRLQIKDRWPDFDMSELPGSDTDVDTRHDIIFCVYQRNKKEANTRMEPTSRPYGYKYIVHSSAQQLEEGGYYDMPAFVTRWKKVSGSHWGHSPAFIALSDILQLNEVVAQTSEAREKEIDPPMKTTERGLLGDLDLRPGSLTVVAEMDELDRLLDPNPQLFQGDAEIDRLQQSIRSTFFIDKLELKESPQMTATEVMVRYERMQRQFAPTLGRLQADLLDPLIELTFRTLQRNGMIPPPPPGLEEQVLDIEYTGPIPRAQKNEQAQNISVWIGELAGLSQVMPDILDVPDSDAVARELATDRGVPARLLHSEEDVRLVREARAEQEQAMMNAQALQETGAGMEAMGRGAQMMEEAE